MGSRLWVINKILFNNCNNNNTTLFYHYFNCECEVYFLMLNLPEKILWIIQRLSAIFICLFTVWFLISINSIELDNYYETINWIKAKNNSILLFIFSFIVLLHSNLGLTVIIDDYVHDLKYKKIFFIIKNSLIIFCISFSGIGLYLI